MQGEWCYFKSYFGRATCESILERGLKIPKQQASLGNGLEFRHDDTYRRSEVRFLDSNDPEFQDLFDAAWRMAVRANADFFNFHITRLPFIQLAEYDAANNGEYKTHHDVFWMNNDPYYHRKLTCVIQLTDPEQYEGGNLELIDTTTFPPAADIRQQGTAIFFPSFFLHKANPVTKGIRHSLACWFEGRKWS